MKQFYRFALICITLLVAAPMYAQFSYRQVQRWVGTGSDTSLLIVDFHQQTDSSYIWGYLHNGVDAETMLHDIAAADSGLYVDIQGGFLNSIIYHRDSGMLGAPDYWSTWSRTGTDTFAMNAGISVTLTNGAWFGCSYTDFTPAIPPREPRTAPTGIGPLGIEAQLHIWPIPARNDLHVSIASTGVHQITIFALTGEVVYQQWSDHKEETLDISGLSAGTYLLRIADSTRKISIW